MSGFRKKGYYILCFIVRTLYNLLRHEKKYHKKVTEKFGGYVL